MCSKCAAGSQLATGIVDTDVNLYQNSQAISGILKGMGGITMGTASHPQHLKLPSSAQMLEKSLITNNDHGLTRRASSSQTNSSCPQTNYNTL